MHTHSLNARLLVVAALLVAGVVVNSCSKGPTDPSDNVTEVFTGTIPFVPGETHLGQHPFHISNNGELFITLVSLTPPLGPARYAQLALGTNTGLNCTYDGTVTNNFAVAGTVLSLPAREGDYCVAVADKGDFTTAETYEIRVSHP